MDEALLGRSTVHEHGELPQWLATTTMSLQWCQHWLDALNNATRLQENKGDGQTTSELVILDATRAMRVYACFSLSWGQHKTALHLSGGTIVGER